MTDDAFNKRVQDLPKELSDKVFDLIFTFKPCEIQVNDEYKFPARLQVNKRSRELFTTCYYHNTTFSFSGELYDGWQNLNKWLEALPVSAVRMLNSIHYHDERPCCDSDESGYQTCESELPMVMGHIVQSIHLRSGATWGEWVPPAEIWVECQRAHQIESIL